MGYLIVLAVAALIVAAFYYPSGGGVMYLFAIFFRLFWSLTIGLVFFAAGLVLFLFLDILVPNSSRGYVVLNNMYKWGSCYWFKGLRMERDDFDVDVKKKRKTEGSAGQDSGGV